MAVFDDLVSACLLGGLREFITDELKPYEAAPGTIEGHLSAVFADPTQVVNYLVRMVEADPPAFVPIQSALEALVQERPEFWIKYEICRLIAGVE